MYAIIKTLTKNFEEKIDWAEVCKDYDPTDSMQTASATKRWIRYKKAMEDSGTAFVPGSDEGVKDKASPKKRARAAEEMGTPSKKAKKTSTEE